MGWPRFAVQWAMLAGKQKNNPARAGLFRRMVFCPARAPSRGTLVALALGPEPILDRDIGIGTGVAVRRGGPEGIPAFDVAGLLMHRLLVNRRDEPVGIAPSRIRRPEQLALRTD